MRNSLILLALTFFLNSCNNIQNQSAIKDGQVKNTITEKHKRIPGTRVYMIIPDGFKISDRLTGIEKNENVGMNIMDIKGGSFEGNAKNFTKVNFESKGINVKEFIEFKLNGAIARLARIQSEPLTESFQMVIGDSTFSAALMAVFPVTDTLAGIAMKNAMLSVVYKFDLIIDPFETAKFTYDNKISNLKLSNFAANMYSFTLNGAANADDSPDGVMLLINQLPPEQSYMMDLKNTSGITLAGMKKYGLSDLVVQSEKPIEINGNKAYNYVGYGFIENKKTLVYQTLIASNKVLLMIVGTAKGNYDSNYQEFEKITNSIIIK